MDKMTSKFPNSFVVNSSWIFIVLFGKELSIHLNNTVQNEWYWFNVDDRDGVS